MDIICGPHWDRRIIELCLPHGDKDYAVFVSGGADSAILLYLLYIVKITVMHPSRIVPFVIPYKENDGALQNAGNVVNRVSELLNCPVPDIVYVEEDKTISKQRVINEPIYRLAKENNNYVQVFTGINHFAPIENVPKVDATSAPRPWRHVEGEDLSKRNIIVTPFLHLYKYHILDLYYRNGIESLLEVTYSCANSKTLDNCGHCYWCRERVWAFEQIEKKDPALKETS